MDVWKAKQQRQITTNQETHLEHCEEPASLCAPNLEGGQQIQWEMIREAQNVPVETEQVLSSLKRTDFKPNSPTYHLGKWL